MVGDEPARKSFYSSIYDRCAPFRILTAEVEVPGNHADDCVTSSVECHRSVETVGRTTEPVSPQSLAKHYRRLAAWLVFVWRKIASDHRLHAKQPKEGSTALSCELGSSHVRRVSSIKNLLSKQRNDHLQLTPIAQSRFRTKDSRDVAIIYDSEKASLGHIGSFASLW